MPGEEEGRFDSQGEQVRGGGDSSPPRPHGSHARFKIVKKKEVNLILLCRFYPGSDGPAGTPYDAPSSPDAPLVAEQRKMFRTKRRSCSRPMPKVI